MRKLCKLNILPLKQRFQFTDLVYFHNILERKVCTELPEYIKLVAKEEVTPDAEVLPRLRTTHKDPLYFDFDVPPRVEVVNQNYFYRAVSLWNNLPLSLRLISDTLHFNRELRKHLEMDALNSPLIETD